MMSGGRRVAQVLGLSLSLAACAAPAAPSRAGSPPAAAPSNSEALPSTPPAAPEAFRLGYPNLSLSYLPILMARDLGYYEQEGLDGDVMLMRANVGQAALVDRKS